MSQESNTIHLYEITRAQSVQIVFLQNRITEQQNLINRLLKSAYDTPISRDTKSVLDYSTSSFLSL